MTSRNSPMNGEPSSTCHESTTSGQLPLISHSTVAPTDEDLLLEKSTPSPPHHHHITLKNNNNMIAIDQKQLIHPIGHGEGDDDDHMIFSSKPQQGCFQIRGRIRYSILLLTVICLTFIRSNELSFNFTVICMNSNETNSIVSFFLKIGLELRIPKCW